MKTPQTLASELYRRVVLVIGFALVIWVCGNVVTTRAQTQAPQKPAATPTTAAVAEKSPAADKTPPITGTLKGRVVSDDGRPLANANVLIQAVTGTPAAKPTRADSEGRFALDDLTPAAYIVFATAPGYIDETLSSGDQSQWPRHLIGAQVKITMIKGGVITGLVTNAKGEPVVGVPVHATNTSESPTAISGFITGGGGSETDDRGIYRIYGLPPGQYTVNAGGKGQFGQFTANGFDLDVPTFYPSSTRDTAVPVPVRGGDDTTGIDIKYKGEDGHTISGAVLGMIEGGSAGPGAVTIFLSHAGTNTVLALGLASATDPRRAFSFNGVADGEYDLFAGFLTGATDNALVGTKRVTVRGGDVTGIELRLAPLSSIVGTVTLDPIKAEEKCDKRESQLIEIVMKLPRAEPKKLGAPTMISMFGGLSGMMNNKGDFGLRNLEAARYRLEIKLPTDSWYVRAINLPGTAGRSALQTQATQRGQPAPAAPGSNQNFWQGVVTLKSGEQIKDVSIMVGQDAAGLRGRLAQEGAAVLEGTRVHLVPVEREQASNVLRYSETLVNSDGSFAFTNIAPGRYFILARVEPPTDVDVTPRPLAWDALTRAKLRLEAEKANTILELKPCERAVDYALKPGG